MTHEIIVSGLFPPTPLAPLLVHILEHRATQTHKDADTQGGIRTRSCGLGATEDSSRLR
jgi:hypothetical protein